MPPAEVQKMPPWKRSLCAVLFMGGGGVTAAWGVHDVAAWIGGSRAGEMVIETDSFILVLLGQLVITVAMDAEGYHTCDVRGRGRFTTVTWGRPDAACHKDPGR